MFDLQGAELGQFVLCGPAASGGDTLGPVINRVPQKGAYRISVVRAIKNIQLWEHAVERDVFKFVVVFDKAANGGELRLNGLKEGRAVKNRPNAGRINVTFAHPVQGADRSMSPVAVRGQRDHDCQLMQTPNMRQTAILDDYSKLT